MAVSIYLRELDKKQVEQVFAEADLNPDFIIEKSFGDGVFGPIVGGRHNWKAGIEATYAARPECEFRRLSPAGRTTINLCMHGLRNLYKRLVEAGATKVEMAFADNDATRDKERYRILNHDCSCSVRTAEDEREDLPLAVCMDDMEEISQAEAAAMIALAKAQEAGEVEGNWLANPESSLLIGYRTLSTDEVGGKVRGFYEAWQNREFIAECAPCPNWSWPPPGTVDETVDEHGGSTWLFEDLNVARPYKKEYDENRNTQPKIMTVPDTQPSTPVERCWAHLAYWPEGTTHGGPACGIHSCKDLDTMRRVMGIGIGKLITANHLYGIVRTYADGYRSSAAEMAQGWLIVEGEQDEVGHLIYDDDGNETISIFHQTMAEAWSRQYEIPIEAVTLANFSIMVDNAPRAVSP